ncbi:MAG: class I SAM-dependent methyltransferase [Promethearchaeota archaeon]|nr:MAG: class I SAM-dependent methyltransferase [Candidatus Lokiarchaeota archaeon]
MYEKEMVMKGYNTIAHDYYTHRDLNKFNNELEEFSNLLPEGGKVLDVGCGAGIPTAKYLVKKGLKVIGIDISDRMLQMARNNVPEAEFILKDMRQLDFDDNVFDGIISVYALFHVPKQEQRMIFQNFHRVLKSGGLLLINTGISESEGVSSFFGVPMFWSNNNPDTTLKFVKESSFSILFEGVLQRGGEYQYWIIAKK